MKKILALIMALLVSCFLFIGCSPDKGNEDPDNGGNGGQESVLPDGGGDESQTPDGGDGILVPPITDGGSYNPGGDY